MSVATLSQVSARTFGGNGGGTIVNTDDSVSQYAGNNTGISFGWGHLSQRYGIHEVGTDVAYGHTICAYSSTFQMPDGAFCWGPYAPDKTDERRSSWCTTPKV